KIAKALRLRLEKPIGALVGTKNPKAYEAYLRALTLGLEISKANNESAIQLLEEAVNPAKGGDPRFAQAHAALAEAYATQCYWISGDSQLLNWSEASAREALKLDPALSAAHYALAYALEGKGQRAPAVREYFASVRTAPHSVPALVSVARWYF